MCWLGCEYRVQRRMVSHLRASRSEFGSPSSCAPSAYRHIHQSPRLDWLANLEAPARSVAGPCPDAVSFAYIGEDLNIDFAEALVRIWRRVVGDRVRIAEILADGFERFHLLLPSLGPVGLPARAIANAPENATGDRIFVHFSRRDYVDGNSLIFRNGSDIIWRHHTGVIGAVGEDDGYFPAWHLSRVPQRQQQRIVQGGIISGH